MNNEAALIGRIVNPGVGGTHGREAAKAELDTMLVGEVNDHLSHLSESISGLAQEIEKTRDAMNESSCQMTALSTSLVGWTRRSVIALIIYTVLTGLLVGLQVVSQLHRKATDQPTRNATSQATSENSHQKKEPSK